MKLVYLKIVLHFIAFNFILAHSVLEYFIFYIVTHAAKHFIQDGGIGIRPILDFYVIRNHIDFDEDIVKDYNVGDTLPVLIFFNNNNEYKRLIGEVSYNEIENVVKEVMNSER